MAEEYFLERFVHHILRGDGHQARWLLNQAGAKEGFQTVLAELLWPTVECAEQLRHDGFLSAGRYNVAVRTLGALIDHAAEGLPGAGSREFRRALLILGAPGDLNELGAQLLSAFAESHGFTVFFGGKDLSAEEIAFASTQLEPDAIVLCGSVTASRQGVKRLCQWMGEMKLRPRAQVMVTGALTAAGGDWLGADLVARGPIETLELLSLCPDYRAPARVHCAIPRTNLCGSGRDIARVSVDSAMIRELLRRGFHAVRTHPN